MDTAAGLLQAYLQDVLHHPECAALDVGQLPEEWREFGGVLSFFTQCVLESNALAQALSRGDLNVKLPPPANGLAAPLRDLHATLKHLTWQTQQVAKGDYRQHMDFMGEFAMAFNAMTEQLERQREAQLMEISSSQRMIQSLAQSNSLYESIAGQIDRWIIVVDARGGEWQLVNRDAADMLADRAAEPQLRRWIKRQVEAHTQLAEIYTTELDLPSESGGQTFSVAIHPMHWQERKTFIFVLTDVSGEKERLTDLQNVAYSDTLTQVYNRRYGMRALGEWLRERRAFALCFADIDDLKHVNDSFGHAEGDRYILSVAGILLGFARDAVVCRMGGDEFMLLIPGWSAESAAARLKLLRKRLSACRDEQTAAYDHGISYGVIGVGAENTLAAEELIAIADERMYEHKRASKLRRGSPAQ